ncbi:MAG: caspase family protein [Candidatus Cloacimonetes bacterium]|nr:caspase family protein [Candidatus Cloacimonadota bacterium]
MFKSVIRNIMDSIYLVCILGLLIISAGLYADLSDEVIALKSWVDAPWAAITLEAERDAKLQDINTTTKDEYETTAQFEQRKQNATKQVAAIKAEYAQKVIDVRAAHDVYLKQLSQRLSALLSQSRETIVVSGTLGNYDADSQRFRVSIPQKTFDIVVPLAKAPEVKQNFSRYQLKVTRQLSDKLDWEYLEARLEGEAGVFSSTDKAPTNSTVSSSTAITPPNLFATVSFNEASGNNILDAEETALLKITINNSGKGAAYMVQANMALVTVTEISYPASVYFGEIKAGESSSKTIELRAGQAIKDDSAELNISFTEQHGFPPDNKIVKFNTKALLPPDLAIADIGIDDQSNNGKIEPGEQVEVRARIQNRGSGIAKAVVAEIILGEGVYLMSGSNLSYPLGDIPSGGTQDLVFSIVTAKTAKNLNLKLDLKESRSQFSKLNQPLNIAFNRIERTADEMVVQAKDSSAIIASATSLSIDIEQNIPTIGKPNPKRWAVIFGIESYRNVSSVRYARRDAEYMKEYFIKTLGIPSENIYMKTDDAATLSEFKTVFDPNGWLSRNAGSKDSEIFIYYSGHGAPDPNGKKTYLLPYDGNPNYASISGYDLEQLYANLQLLKVKQISLFLDSCFSGANRDNEIILASARPVFISTSLPSVSSNLAVFSAASGSQISSGYGDQQHGLFSYFLMKGLRGEADANGDKKLSQQELSDYLAAQVSVAARRMGREQDPGLQSGDPSKVLLQW